MSSTELEAGRDPNGGRRPTAAEQEGEKGWQRKGGGERKKLMRESHLLWENIV